MNCECKNSDTSLAWWVLPLAVAAVLYVVIMIPLPDLNTILTASGLLAVVVAAVIITLAYERKKEKKKQREWEEQFKDWKFKDTRGSMPKGWMIENKEDDNSDYRSWSL